jgi:hypothetical protein
VRSRWLDWAPGAEMPEKRSEVEPSKPSKPGSVGFDGADHTRFSITSDPSGTAGQTHETHAAALEVSVNGTIAPRPSGTHERPATTAGQSRFVPGTSISVPLGVRVIGYFPTQPDRGVATGMKIVNLAKFIETLLADLDARLNHPVQIRGGGSVFGILAKLADIGLELAIERPEAVPSEGLLPLVTEDTEPESVAGKPNGGAQ